MQESTLARQALDAWTATLDHMHAGLAEMLAGVSDPQSPPPIPEDQPGRIPLGRLDQRFVDWEAVLQGMEQEVQEAEATPREHIAELQSWTAKMTEAREKLAKAAGRAV